MENTLTNEKNTNKNTEEENMMRNAEVDPRSKSVYCLYKAILNHFSLAPYYMSLTPENNLEDMPAISDDDFKKVLKALKSSIPQKQATVLVLRYGLDCGIPKTIEEVAKTHKTTTARIKQLENSGLGEMRSIRSLSKLPSLFGFVSPAELNSVNINPDVTDIIYLNIGPIPYNAMKRANINTIGDILDYPKENWSKVEYLSSKYADQVQEAMHRIGFTDFCIN